MGVISTIRLEASSLISQEDADDTAAKTFYEDITNVDNCSKVTSSVLCPNVPVPAYPL